MARIIGDKALNAKMTRLARGVNVTPALVKAAERTRTAYVQAVQEQSPGRQETRYSPRREVTVSAPGSSPNADTGTLVNSTGVVSERVNKAETFASADYADDLEFGTNKMAPRPAMRPAFEENRKYALDQITAELRRQNRNG